VCIKSFISDISSAGSFMITNHYSQQFFKNLPLHLPCCLKHFSLAPSWSKVVLNQQKCLLSCCTVICEVFYIYRRMLNTVHQGFFFLTLLFKWFWALFAFSPCHEVYLTNRHWSVMSSLYKVCVHEGTVDLCSGTASPQQTGKHLKAIRSHCH